MCTSSRKSFYFFCFLFVVSLIIVLFGIYTGVRFCVSSPRNADIFAVDYDVFVGRTVIIDAIITIILPAAFASLTFSALSFLAVYTFSFINCLAIFFVYHTGRLSPLMTVVSCCVFALCCLWLVFASSLGTALTVRKIATQLISDLRKNRKTLFLKAALYFTVSALFALFVCIYCYIIF